MHTVYDLLEAIADKRLPEPNFHDGLKNQLVLAAIEESSSATTMGGGMKLGVFAVLFGSKPFEEMLDSSSISGSRRSRSAPARIPGNAHCDPPALLGATASVAARFKDAIQSRGLVISALSCHGNPLHPERERAGATTRCSSRPSSLRSGSRSAP